ncbi:DUF3857 domain-containing protein [Pseudoalteromonas luteoviolacea]|uniref:DUF3857 domain-containing protein n=1 Tax=Pseudoalteromonas luteoviolacea TaxID=43657 RepID=UPI001B392E2D|nr:DUF3857 domain-containing protein [Pseudoalteromonas luteoviolacea]MBQ4811547.1 DUF3857 domain-containing protein [Pseudoalteromonas luteoviolacea]
MMTKWPVYIVLIFFISTAWQVNAIDKAPEIAFGQVPNWVNDVALTELPAQLDKPMHYRLLDRQVNTEANFAYFVRSRYQYTDSAGVQDNAAIRIRFNPAFEQLTFHKVHVYRNNKLIQSVGKEQVKLINAEDEQQGNLYSGEYEALILLKDIRVGDELEYSYTMKGQNPVFNGNFGHFASFGWSVDIDKVSFNLFTDPTRKLQVKTTQESLQPTIRSTEHGTLYHIEVLDSKKILADSDMPSWYTPYPYVQFSQYQNWQHLKEWANSLFENTQVKNEALLAYITKLQKMAKRDAVNEAIRFTQEDIRYLGLELGVNSHLPRSPDEVFANRYGDCKDKALLLKVLLDAVEVKASPVLVSSIEREKISDYLPTHQAFNHVINRIEFNGNQYFVDATMSYQGSDIESLYQPDYGKALLIDETKQTIIDATPTTRNSKVIVKEDIFSANYFSPVVWHIRTSMKGADAEAFRYRMATQGIDAIADSYANFYANSYPSLEVEQKMQVLDDPVTNTITVEENYSVPNFWVVNEKNEAEFGFYANFAHDYTKLPKSIRRSSPLHTSFPVDVVHAVTLHLPEDIDFSNQEFSEVVNSQYLQYSSQLRYDKKRLTLTNKYRSLSSYVPKSDVAKHISNLKKINDLKGYWGMVTNVIRQPVDAKFDVMLNNIKQNAQQSEE